MKRHGGMVLMLGQARQQEEKCIELRRRADHFQSEMEESKLQASPLKARLYPMKALGLGPP
jgi:hypothetical protein